MSALRQKQQLFTVSEVLKEIAFDLVSESYDDSGDESYKPLSSEHSKSSDR